MSHSSFWGTPDVWTCRGCSDGSPVDNEGFCEECREVYRREHEEHLDQELEPHLKQCDTCGERAIFKLNTCTPCVEEIYKPEGRWCNEHGAHFGRCSECGDQLILDGV